MESMVLSARALSAVAEVLPQLEKLQTKAVVHSIRTLSVLTGVLSQLEEPQMESLVQSALVSLSAWAEVLSHMEELRTELRVHPARTLAAMVWVLVLL
jgi:hypothetical protein